jgi:hypothetical protein
MPNRALFDKSKIISDFRKMIELDSMIIVNEKITKMIEEYKANKELASTPIIINENDNKEDVTTIESDDDRKQRLLKSGFFGITPGLTIDNKLKYGGEFNKK